MTPTGERQGRSRVSETQPGRGIAPKRITQPVHWFKSGKEKKNSVAPRKLSHNKKSGRLSSKRRVNFSQPIEKNGRHQIETNLKAQNAKALPKHLEIQRLCLKQKIALRSSCCQRKKKKNTHRRDTAYRLIGAETGPSRKLGREKIKRSTMGPFHIRTKTFPATESDLGVGVVKLPNIRAQ